MGKKSRERHPCEGRTYPPLQLWKPYPPAVGALVGRRDFLSSGKGEVLSILSSYGERQRREGECKPASPLDRAICIFSMRMIGDGESRPHGKKRPLKKGVHLQREKKIMIEEREEKGYPPRFHKGDTVLLLPEKKENNVREFSSVIREGTNYRLKSTDLTLGSKRGLA